MIPIYIKSRNLFIDNFLVDVNYIYTDNKIIDLTKSYLKYLLLISPFSLISFLSTYYNYHIIYKKDNIYYTTNSNNNNIIPYVKSVQVKGLHVDTLDLTTQFKKFNSSVPLWAFMKINNIEDCEHIEISYMKAGENITKKIVIDNELDINIHEIFNTNCVI